jgi:hypothetical protein
MTTLAGKDADMSGNTASSKGNDGTEPSGPPATGYRVSVVPGALEISARLSTPEEVRNLMKVLRAGLTILEDTTDGNMDKPLSLTKRVAGMGTAATKQENKCVPAVSGVSLV